MSNPFRFTESEREAALNPQPQIDQDLALLIATCARFTQNYCDTPRLKEEARELELWALDLYEAGDMSQEELAYAAAYPDGEE